jgi:hypothetical protein
VRQAFETTLMTEIELVIFHVVSVRVFTEVKKQTHPLLLEYHDVQLFLFCLCLVVKEQFHALTSTSGSCQSPFLAHSVYLSK